MATPQRKLDERSMRVYCPDHGVSFTAPFASMIRCENRGHELAQQFPVESFWQYCCDCQNYWPSEVARSNSLGKDCPVCDRPSVRYFLCEGCKVISIESDDQRVPRKQVRLQPAPGESIACAGCDLAAPEVLPQHHCAEIHATLLTNVATCPFCQENLRPRANFVTVPSPASTPAAGAPLPLPRPAAPAMAFVSCPKCLTTNVGDGYFCRSCGENLRDRRGPVQPAPAPPIPVNGVRPQAPTSPFAPAGIPAAAPAAGTTFSRRPVLWGAAGLVVALTAVIGIVYLAASSSTATAGIESKLDAAIAQNNLIGPNGDSAFDYYQQLKQNNASASVLKRYAGLLLPKLKGYPEGLIGEQKKFDATKVSVSEWQQAAKLMSWANEIDPQDKDVAARAAYCAGRVAFLNQDFAEAIKQWTKAGELDKTLALPYNDLGYLYLFKYKDPESARGYYNEAIGRDASWAVPRLYRGQTYYQQANYYQARAEYDEANRLAGNWPRVHAALGNLALRRARDAKAAGNFTEAQTELELARTELQRALELEGNDASFKRATVDTDMIEVEKETRSMGAGESE